MKMPTTQSKNAKGQRERAREPSDEKKVKD